MDKKTPQAFPTLSSTNEIGRDGKERHAQSHYCEPGMTLRDYVAAKALNGLLAADPLMDDAEAARRAYRHADAMLKAREGK